ncbi:DUF6893 family small protein [Kribbella sp.]
MRWVIVAIVVVIVGGVGYAFIPDSLRYLRLRNM